VAISVTAKAVNRIADLKKKRQTPDHVFRVGIKGGGCSGLSYFVDFAEAPGAKDKLFTFDNGVTVAIDRKSYLFLNGTEIDFEDTLMRRGFVFNNPLAQTSCSCGDSFSI
jgi:iron-sulfur cluster assembly protein